MTRARSAFTEFSMSLSAGGATATMVTANLRKMTAALTSTAAGVQKVEN